MTREDMIDEAVRRSPFWVFDHLCGAVQSQRPKLAMICVNCAEAAACIRAEFARIAQERET